jgi:hypothetical protein
MNALERLRGELGSQPVEPAQRPVLFINPRSGDGKAQQCVAA